MSNSSQYGAFIQTTAVWDMALLESVDISSPEFKELLVRLYQNINNIALILNIKDTGMYQLSEFVNGQLFFPNPNNNSTTAQLPANRQVFRKIINFGVLPNAAVLSSPHNISVTSATTFTRIYGCASDTTGLTYIPLPYASNVAGNSIELSVSSTDVIITTGSNRSNYNVCYVLLEYLQQ